ncbi:hypothetical protein F5Y19DRAFT_468820 [Xylariaceae sp. FL1651]|nr:hypothetical protein F5Y19DRAFT_468820 [Xylariaceae sp. FL1651]
MTSLSQLETQCAELAAAIQSLVTCCRSQGALGECSKTSIGGTPQPLMLPNNLNEAYRIRKSVLGHLTYIQSLLQQPDDFLQHLATQNQLLACLRWLGDFQVLAFIPLQGSVMMRDVADLSGTPETQLVRVVHMMSTVGFLHEPQLGYVAHTALSVPFVTKPSLLDAALFLAEIAAPSALHMSAATQKFGLSERIDETAYNLAFSTPASFASSYMQRPRLQRQWPAYLRYGAGDFETNLLDILSHYDWNSMGSATVVEVGACSTATATALAALYPSLHFVVQMSDPFANGCQSDPVRHNQSFRPGSARITIQQRAPGALQTVLDGAVYIIHLHIASLAVPSPEVPARIVAELRANIGVLRADRRATLLLVTSPLLRAGGTTPDVQAATRLRDLSQWQLSNGREMDMEEFCELLSGMGDSMGGLSIVNQYSAPNSPLVIIEVRYQLHLNARASF